MTSDAAADAGQDDYDEFGMLKLYADHEGIPWRGTPVVDRQFVDVYGQRISALVWGSGDPQIVLIHGGAQNAHTWDSVAMALDRPLVAIDLPGHGHSDWRDDHDYRGITNAPAVAAVISELAPNAKLVMGMSLGGLTLISLSAQRPDLVRRSVHVHDEDVVEFRTHQPSLRVEVVEDAGHSVQSDKPLRLVALVNDFLATKPEPNPEHRNQSGQRKGRG